MVDALLRTRVPRWQELNRAIDDRDDMLDFTVQQFDHDRDRALTSYFQNAIEQFRLVRHIAGWRTRGGGQVPRMLDFASGYGRLTRLLVHEKLAGEVTVSDILEGGMQFQAEQFGVRTILSATQPENFVASERYDLIFVASLFTHLPAVTFTPWLRRLADLLTPDGLLIFTVHDVSLAPEPFEGGIRFDSSSESRVLDVNDYGSTWVTEEFVRAQVSTLSRSNASEFACIRMPRALAEWQDVYVISPSPIPDASPRRVPRGFIDVFEVTSIGVRVEGWATAVEERADRVEFRVDDEVVAITREFAPRPDVASAIGTPSATDSGWELAIPHDAIRSFRYQVVTISAFSRAGEECILFLGTLESRDGQTAREIANAQQHELAVQSAELATLRHELSVQTHQRAEAETQLAAMRESRFWKARERWFSLKRTLRLTDEL